MKALGSWQRKEILMHCVKQFTERKDELAMALCVEAGKPIKARGPTRGALFSSRSARSARCVWTAQLRSESGSNCALKAGRPCVLVRLANVSSKLWQRAGSARSARAEGGAVLLTASRMRQDSHGEVMRLIDTFQIAAEECTRMYGAEPPIRNCAKERCTVGLPCFAATDALRPPCLLGVTSR